MDKLEFLDSPQGEVDELLPEAPEAVTPEPEQQPAEPEPQPEAVAPAPPQPEPGFVPLAAVLDERERRKELEARLKAIESTQQEAPAIPDAVDDPDGFNQHVSQTIQQQNYQTRLYFSEKLAEVQHGADVVTKAKEWGLARCGADPHFNAKVASSQDPYGVVIAEYLKDQIASEVTPTDFEAFKAWKAAQAAAAAETAAMQPAAPAAPQPPTRSLASAPSAGGADHVPTGPGQAFDSLFKG